MSPKVVRLGSLVDEASFSGKKAKRRFSQPRLPLDPTDFAGRVLFWPDLRVDGPFFDRALQFEGIKTILDLRDSPSLGRSRSRHHSRCHLLERWGIGYVRLGPLIAKAEQASVLSFEIARSFAAVLRTDGSLMTRLRECPDLGAVLVIHPDSGERLDVFLDASRHLGLSAFDALPFRIRLVSVQPTRPGSPPVR